MKRWIISPALLGLPCLALFAISVPTLAADEEVSETIVVHAKGCKTCGKTTITATYPVVSGPNRSVVAKTENSELSKEDENKLHECMGILNQSGITTFFMISEMVKLYKNGRDSALNNPNDNKGNQMHFDNIKSQTANRDAALQEWADAGCNEFLGSETVSQVNNIATTAAGP